MSPGSPIEVRSKSASEPVIEVIRSSPAVKEDFYCLSQDGGRLYSEIWGKGPTNIQVNHGSTDVPSYGRLLSETVDSATLAIPHRRGMGQSEGIIRSTDPMLTQLVDDLTRVKQSLNIPRWDVIAGDSFGAALSLIQASKGQCDGLILFAPSLICHSQWTILFDREQTPFPHSRARIDQLLKAEYPELHQSGNWSVRDYIQVLDHELDNVCKYRADSRERSLRTCMSWSLFGNETSPLLYAPGRIDQIVRFAEERVCFVRVMAEQLSQTGATNMLDVAKQVTVPCTIIHDRDDPFVPFENSTKLVDVMPNCSLVEVQGVGHNFSDARVLSVAADAISDLMINQASVMLSRHSGPKDFREVIL